MDYIGSKVKINDWLFDIIKESTGKIKGKVFLDACSGSGAVSRYAAGVGYSVLSNDLMLFPSVIANGSIGLKESQRELAVKEIERLNSLEGTTAGYFYSNFCDKSEPPRLYFTASNAGLIDRIRKEIDQIPSGKVRDFLLYCGLEAMSRVSNTTGVQAAFLKQFKDRAKEKFLLRAETVVDGDVVTFNEDILVLLNSKLFRKKFSEDILYLDPPYNQRQYGPNYHLYETFIRNDNPKAAGKTGLRNWKAECNSPFCTSKKCLDFLKAVLASSTAKVAFVSYNSDGLLTRKEFEESFPSLRVHEKSQRRYKADASDERQYNEQQLVEYVFEIPLK